MRYLRYLSPAVFLGFSNLTYHIKSITEVTEIAQRLLRVQIENDTAADVIKRYDSPETLFYCDPPYPHDSRSDQNAYAYEMTDAEHRTLANVLHNVDGKVALSSYDSALMDELYSDWNRIEAPLNCAIPQKLPGAKYSGRTIRLRRGIYARAFRHP